MLSAVSLAYMKTDKTGCRAGGFNEGETARMKTARKEFERGKTKHTTKEGGSDEAIQSLITWSTPSSGE